METEIQGDWYSHDQKSTDVTLGNLKLLCEQMYIFRDEADELKAKHSEKVKLWRNLEYKILEILQDSGMTNFDMGDGKKISLKKNIVVNLPEDPNSYEMLIGYIEQNAQKFFFNVNKTKLKSYITNEREGRGDEEWLPPGVDRPEEQYSLSMAGRKK